MSKVMLDFKPKFNQSERIQKLAKRSRELAISGKRNLYGPDVNDWEALIYGWFGQKEKPVKESTIYGDHACWIDIGPFPKIDEMPSKVSGYEATGESWGRDYAFLLDNSPIEIFENERIVGEIHWEMHMVRQQIWPESVRKAGKKAREMGAAGMSSGHTCPDLSIGLSQGWEGVLERIKKSREKYEQLDDKKNPPTCMDCR